MKSWRVFHDRLLIGRCFQGFVLPVLDYCSAKLCSAADSHLKHWCQFCQWCQFCNWGVFECDVAHRRSVAVLCMLYKIRCNQMHPRYDALPAPYVPVRVTLAVLLSHIGILETIVFYSLSLSLLSVYRLVLWGWGLRTDRVYITLSQPCTADLF